MSHSCSCVVLFPFRNCGNRGLYPGGDRRLGDCSGRDSMETQQVPVRHSPSASDRGRHWRNYIDIHRCILQPDWTIFFGMIYITSSNASDTCIHLGFFFFYTVSFNHVDFYKVPHYGKCEDLFDMYIDL